ncbi:MAG: glycosyltransferase, partial [Kineosporiaceae bacterium]
MSTGSLRVCHLLGELRPSGAERMLVVAAPDYARMGCVGDVFAFAEQEGEYADTLRAAGFPVVHGSVRRRTDILRHVRRHVRRGRYDVLHQHGERMSFWVALLARLQGVRVVRTVHNSFSYTGRLRVYRAVQRALARSIGVRYVAVSASVAETERRVLHNPCLVVENWIDVEAFGDVSAAERAEARA